MVDTGGKAEAAGHVMTIPASWIGEDVCARYGGVHACMSVNVAFFGPVSTITTCPLPSETLSPFLGPCMAPALGEELPPHLTALMRFLYTRYQHVFGIAFVIDRSTCVIKG